jgi:transposase InsO family protein
MAKGFLYLVVAIDWYSRHVPAWRLSDTMDTAFCLAGLEDALPGATWRSSTEMRLAGPANAMAEGFVRFFEKAGSKHSGPDRQDRMPCSGTRLGRRSSLRG